MAWNQQWFVVQHDNLKHGTRQFILDGEPVDASTTYGPYNERQSAADKAMRLAEDNPGWSFVVCSTQGAFQATPPAARWIEGK